MDLEQGSELAVIRRAVVMRFRERAYFNSSRSKPILQYLAVPVFGNPCCLDSLRRTQDREIIVQRTCWRWDLDVEAFSSPVERQRHPRPFEPTIESIILDVDVERLEAALARLSRSNVPLAFENPAKGVDGVSYELELGTFWASCRLRWWHTMPEQWSSLRKFVDEIQHLCESTERHGGAA
jgi:hypothetical protein